MHRSSYAQQLTAVVCCGWLLKLRALHSIASKKAQKSRSLLFSILYNHYYYHSTCKACVQKSQYRIVMRHFLNKQLCLKQTGKIFFQITKPTCQQGALLKKSNNIQCVYNIRGKKVGRHLISSFKCACLFFSSRGRNRTALGWLLAER